MSEEPKDPSERPKRAKWPVADVSWWPLDLPGLPPGRRTRTQRLIEYLVGTILLAACVAYLLWR
ncbi:MAG: hypothetical protein ACYC35_09445 [Pirellulales bacterium]